MKAGTKSLAIKPCACARACARLRVNARARARAFRVRACLYACVFACVPVCVRACLCACLFVCVRVRVHVFVYVFVRVCARTRADVGLRPLHEAGSHRRQFAQPSPVPRLDGRTHGAWARRSRSRTSAPDDVNALYPLTATSSKIGRYS
eukprot:6212750-Pleurochrysis_carterae.AAC.2